MRKMAKIMTVDDEPDVRFVIREILEKDGHKVVEAGSGRECLQKLKKEKPGQILWEAVYGMLPKNKLRDYRIKRLKLYMTTEHPHEAQKPVLLNL